MANTVTISVQFGSDASVVTIRETTRSAPIVADVLGVETDLLGKPSKVYLRAKIHSAKSENVDFRGWQPSGAISTILTRLD